VTEVHPVALGFMHSLSSMLNPSEKAAAIFLDYGFPAHEYYLGQRREGTLMCHYRHHSHDDPFFLPGLQDITAHVDFSAMAQAAAAGGLEVLSYTSQAAFLIDAGIGDLLMRTSPESAARYLPQANALQRLVSPAEMGELFKVLVLGQGVSLPDRFSRSDRSHRL
jgi:SAM-dependent MidA family methyltransferase